MGDEPSIAVIELNDSDIRVARGAEIVLRSPGYAIVAEQNVEVGEPALRKAWLNPRATQHQYWFKLNLEPLQNPTAGARHHADLAYAHLLAIHDRAGQPEEVVFAVPGDYSNEQLALLLGLAEASPFNAIGLVDAAVAAAASSSGPGIYTHAELYLHCTLLTRIEIGGDVSRTAVEVVEGAGWAAMLDNCAAIISDLFIEQSRFDPQHHAETEQSLYDQIPGALSALNERDEITIEIPYQDATYLAKLRRAAILEALQPGCRRIAKALAGNGMTLVGDRLARLPGFTDMLETFGVLSPDAVFQTCRQQLDRIRSSGSALEFVTRLASPPAAGIPQSRAPERDAGEAADAPEQHEELPVTHLLCGHCAYPLGAGRIYLDARTCRVRDTVDEANVSLSSEAGRVSVQPENGSRVMINGRDIEAPAAVRIGDRLSFGASGRECRFINVPR